MNQARARSPFADLLAGLNAGQHLSVDAVVAFVDGELSLGAHERAAAHVVCCSPCGAEVGAQRQARSRVRSAGGPSMPAGLLAALCAIPERAELPEPPAGLAVAPDGTLAALSSAGLGIGPAPLGATSLGATSPLGSGPLGSGPRLGSSRLGSSPRLGAAGLARRAARPGAGVVVSGLVLGALMLASAGGSAVGGNARPERPAPVAVPAADPVRVSPPAEARVRIDLARLTGIEAR